MTKKIAIIGAGPCGLAAIKSCKEEGFIPVCYERNSEIGGLWHYHEEDIEGVASVMRTTIINTSKEMSAFSDFPPPRDSPNYMHNSKMFDYFSLYAQEFDLVRHVKFNFEVVKVERTSNFDETGQWTVSVKSTQTYAVSKEDFDAVMVCIGHHVYPKIPTFPGQEKFKGSITHTHSLKNCDAYAGKSVVVIGIGNSGVDAAVDCTYVAEKVYLSTRRGSWIFARVGHNGVPFDINFSTRKNAIMASFKSYDSLCDDIERMAEEKIDHASFNLKPKHRILGAHPTMNDAIPNCILSGKVVVKGDVNRFEENGIVFAGEDTVTEIDAVILATGYHIKFPFLEENLVTTKENKVLVYKNCIPPNIKHHTLCIVGLCQPIGAIFPVGEMQSRWFVQIQAGKVKLPSIEEMVKDCNKKNEANAKRYVDSTRHTIQVDWIPTMDEIASLFGAKPNLFKMALTDPKLFWACINGPCLPYQYRLQGPHPWDGARDAIMSVEERLYAPLNKEAKKLSSKKNSKFISKKSFAFLLIVSAAGIYYGRKNVDFSNVKVLFNM